MIRVRTMAITTDASGNCVRTLVVRTPAKLYAAQWVDGDLADGVAATLVCVQFGPRTLEITLLNLTAANNDALYYPLVTGDDNTGAEIATAFVQPLVHGTLTLTVSAGGNAKSGALWLYLEE